MALGGSWRWDHPVQSPGNSFKDSGYAWRVQSRAVLFDLDSTLFDHPSSARAGVDAFLKHLGTGCSYELTRSSFEIEEVNYNRFLTKELTFQEQRRERLRQFPDVSVA